MVVESERQKDFFDVCRECKSHCCRGAKPPITFQRRKIIEAYLKGQKILVENPFVQAAYTFPKEDADGCCVFYDKKTAKCLVHPVKPETCVAGPITFDINTKTRKIEWHLKMERICMLAGKMRQNQPTLKKHAESAKKEILRLVSELDSKALKAILKIEEPETIKIEEDDVEQEILDKLANNS